MEANIILSTKVKNNRNNVSENLEVLNITFNWSEFYVFLIALLNDKTFFEWNL